MVSTRSPKKTATPKRSIEGDLKIQEPVTDETVLPTVEHTKKLDTSEISDEKSDKSKISDEDSMEKSAVSPSKKLDNSEISEGKSEKSEISDGDSTEKSAPSADCKFSPGENSKGFFVFTLTSGFEIVSSEAAASAFESDWDGYILSKQVFGSKEDAVKFTATLSRATPSTPMKEIVNVDEEPKISSSSAARLSGAIAKLQGKKPVNRMNIHYKTNNASHVCVVIVECLNYKGDPQWNVKPDILVEPLQLFAKEFPDDDDSATIVSDTVVGECFYNIDKYVIRDMSSGPEAPLVVKWTSPDKSRQFDYEQFLFGTKFTIPVDAIANEQQEQEFIESKLTLFGATPKKVMTSPVFARLHEANCPKESIWKAMNGKGDKKGGITFRAYVQEAVTLVTKCPNLNAYVTKSESDKFMAMLWDGRPSGGGTKY